MDVHNKLRSKIRECSSVSEHVRVSLQTCHILKYEDILTERISYVEQKLSLTHENQAHSQSLRGLRAILQILLANVEIPGKTVQHSFLNFEDAFALFLSFKVDALNEMLADRHQKKMFTDHICHPKYGIPVYIVKNQYIVLRLGEVDLDLFLEEISKPTDRLGGETFSATQVKDMLQCLDTAWDKKVCKVILGENLTKNDRIETGLGSRVKKYRLDVIATIEKRKALRHKAEDIVKMELQNMLQKIEHTTLKEEASLQRSFMSKEQKEEITEKIEDLEARKFNLQEILEQKNMKGFQQMVNRKYRNLIMEERVGLRKASSGRPQVIDEEDETFVLQCIEEKSTAHGRRHDAVLYTGHRVKKRDFLRLANYSRISRGLKPIKSATTVFNRARPRNKRSIQTNKHLGLGLFCAKKPPKMKDNENILTHHQRAFKRGILLRQLHQSKAEESNFNLFISRDDKAYICPGTSTGNALFDLEHTALSKERESSISS